MHIQGLPAIFLTAALVAACNRTEGTTKMTQAVDWNALEFKCVHERDLWPQLDPEAEAWYQEGRKLQKTGNERYNGKVLELMLKAAERSHIKALNNLVLMYLEGDGVEPSEKKAVKYAERLIGMNVGVGYYHMGVFLQQGIGVKQDRVAALAYFRRSADLGNGQGQYEVGKRLLEDFKLTPEKGKVVPVGIKMLECALAQGRAEAGQNLGYDFAEAEGKPELALPYFQKAAALGDVGSLFALFTIFRDGEYGVTKDPQRAQCYEKLWREAEAEKGKTFPNLDKICPLPPKPMPA